MISGVGRPHLHHAGPARDVPQVELPGAAQGAPKALVLHLVGQLLVEEDHAAQGGLRQAWVQAACQDLKVPLPQGLQGQLGEAVEEGARQAPSCPTLPVRILAAEQTGAAPRHPEATVQLGHKHRPPVVQAGVEALQDALGSQVQLQREGRVTAMPFMMRL